MLPRLRGYRPIAATLAPGRAAGLKSGDKYTVPIISNRIWHQCKLFHGAQSPPECNLGDSIPILLRTSPITQSSDTVHSDLWRELSILSPKLAQNLINPLWRRIGCNVNRDIPGLLRQGGFAIDSLDTMYLPGTPRFGGFNYWGMARVG